MLALVRGFARLCRVFFGPVVVLFTGFPVGLLFVFRRCSFGFAFRFLRCFAGFPSFSYLFHISLRVRAFFRVRAYLCCCLSGLTVFALVDLLIREVEQAPVTGERGGRPAPRGCRRQAAARGAGGPSVLFLG